MNNAALCRKEDDFELDEEDYDLLQEADIIGFRRPSKVCSGTFEVGVFRTCGVKKLGQYFSGTLVTCIAIK